MFAFLKRKSESYRPKKSSILTRDQIETFLNTVPDAQFLMMKVATIIELFGASRREELYKFSVDNIKRLENKVLVELPDTKTKN